MALELAPEFMKHVERKPFRRRDFASEMTDALVLGENPGDERLIGIEEAGTGGEQDFLLLTEVLEALRVPVRQEALASTDCR